MRAAARRKNRTIKLGRAVMLKNQAIEAKKEGRYDDAIILAKKAISASEEAGGSARLNEIMEDLIRECSSAEGHFEIESVKAKKLAEEKRKQAAADRIRKKIKIEKSKERLAEERKIREEKRKEDLKEEKADFEEKFRREEKVYIWRGYQVKNELEKAINEFRKKLGNLKDLTPKQFIEKRSIPELKVKADLILKYLKPLQAQLIHVIKRGLKLLKNNLKRKSKLNKEGLELLQTHTKDHLELMEVRGLTKKLSKYSKEILDELDEILDYWIYISKKGKLPGYSLLHGKRLSKYNLQKILHPFYRLDKEDIELLKRTDQLISAKLYVKQTPGERIKKRTLEDARKRMVYY